MKINKRKIVFISFIIYSILITIAMIMWNLFNFTDIKNILLSLGYIFLTIVIINGLFHYVIEGKRSDSFDLYSIFYLFVTIFLLTDDIMNSFIGAFSIYLIFGISELKEYEVLNKLLLISVITYNFIFISGLINVVLKNIGLIDTNVIRDTAFSMSIWVMLILGFALFGRKYLVVFRFMSPQYLTMFLFIIAWMAVRFISDFITDITRFIYLFLILTNWFVYIISGPILDFMLGIKKTDNQELSELVGQVKNKIGLKGKVKVGFGQYPILNAMAYGAIFDKRIAIIAPDINSIPKDELKGIIAHELNHSKGGFKNIPDTLTLSILSTIELAIFWIFKLPATMYDYTFAPESQPFPLWVFILLNIGISVILYIFVRILESAADLNTKKNGYGYELAKGLYNLEGFYSSGREIGLDTMLLSKEKITEENRITNYSDTAEYINYNMFEPKRTTLLSNLMNSHPPSYHRIISMLSSQNQQIKPSRESILPFSLMISKKRNEFSLEYWNARQKFNEMANKKFKTMFNIQNYKELLNTMNKKELFKLDIGKIYLYYDKYRMKISIVKLEDIILNDDVSSPISYKFRLLKVNFNDYLENSVYNEERISHDKSQFDLLIKNETNPEYFIENPLFFVLKELDFFRDYYNKKSKHLEKLIGIKIPSNNLSDIFNKIIASDRINQEDIEVYLKKREKLLKKFKKESIIFFADSKSKRIISNQIFKKKMNFDFNYIEKTINKEIFLEEQSTLKILRLEKFERDNKNFLNSTLICKNERYSDLILNESENHEYNKHDKNIENKENNEKNENNTKHKIIDEAENNTEEKLEIELNTKKMKQFYNYSLKDLIIKKEEFAFMFHNDEITKRFEKELLLYLKENNIRITLYLKKAVNNKEAGYIKSINFIDEGNDNNKDKNKDKNKIKEKNKEKEDSKLIIQNIFNQEIIIPFNKIEIIIFLDNTILFKNKNKLSFGDKIIEKISNFRHPDQSFNS